MNVAHRQRIGRAFGAAGDYDGHAHVQRVVAESLADRIAAISLPAKARILEIGCGTGFLTRALIDRGVGGDWLVTDIAPAMVDRCRALVGDGERRRFAVLDGEHDLPEDDRYDLICSSLAMQWFDDQHAALGRMLGALTPGGHCLFTTLGAGSFAEWRAAHIVAGCEAGTLSFPSAETLKAMYPEAQRAEPVVDALIERHDSALDFMRALRAIGAHTPSREHRPLSPAKLRRVMAAFEAGGCSVTYEVVTCHFGRAERVA
ncbi:methyltransferase domain-containing protein [Croceicoccus ponticola]|uniref:Methyltransferase domain-containing protein n=1 Tax=Croceicoccus ponticola TaxID=2217664 RepID=A0A437GXR2_9SPHN|nr:methyltransferase domain-containing protein [Croceicoccus ponticola]RVQ66026.1 methyltransferase domain-containing protein [Croceicoccus ponticola]